jgi:endonuclease/exonuclease/phosphatase family metal-dependent hydrolase
MRIASYNVENLFERVRAMNFDERSEGRPVLNDYARLNTLIAKPTYTAADKAAMVDALKALGLGSKSDGPLAILRENRGKFIKRSGSALQIVANGRAEWVGWVELKTEAVNEVAMRMTAKVIREVNADVLAVIEAENRTALCHFDEQLLKPLGTQYEHIMLIDGNDERGIDVGLLTKERFSIESMVSHVDDKQNAKTIFSRDCPEYSVRAGTASLLVIVNHLKSKGYGTPAQSNAKRLLQATRVRQIYDQRRAEGFDLIAIVGDFNDTPTSAPLKPLLKNGSDLRDITEHPAFVGDGRPGTFGNGTASNKIDYILLSPKLFEKVTGGGIFRKGVWGGANGTLFPHFEEMTKPYHAASDHAAIFADIELG